MEKWVTATTTITIAVSVSNASCVLKTDESHHSYAHSNIPNRYYYYSNLGQGWDLNSCSIILVLTLLTIMTNA